MHGVCHTAHNGHLHVLYVAETPMNSSRSTTSKPPSGKVSWQGRHTASKAWVRQGIKAMDKFWARLVHCCIHYEIHAYGARIHSPLTSCRHDATDDIHPELHGKLHKLDYSPYQSALLRYMLRVCRKTARTANETKPEMCDIESMVKG